MRALLGLLILIGSAAPAAAQASEADLIKSVAGVSITLALLILLAIGVFRFLLSDRTRLLTTIDKLTEKVSQLEGEKLAMVREILPLAKDNAEAFKEARATMEAIHAFVKAADSRNIAMLASRPQP